MVWSVFQKGVIHCRPQPHARAPSERIERRVRCGKLGLATHYTLLEDDLDDRFPIAHTDQVQDAVEAERRQ